jgi:hypothetical protein
MMGEDTAQKAITKPSSKSASTSSRNARNTKNGNDAVLEESGEKGKGSDLQRRLATVCPAHYQRLNPLTGRKVTAERDRYREQRNTYSKQFDDLSKMRNTDVETLFEKHKEVTNVQSKGVCYARA